MKEKLNKRSRRLLIILSALLLVSLTTGGLLAKYTTENKREAEMLAADFYISSNYLMKDSIDYVVSDWESKGIDIQLYNYETENVALVTKEAITYKVNVNDNWTVSVKNSSDTAVAESAEKTYVISGEENNENREVHTIHLEYNGTGTAPKSLTVTVETTDPYVKTLTANFVLQGTKTPDYKIEDKGNYCLVKIHTNDHEGDITVQWDEKFSPDNTNPVMSSWSDSNRTIGENMSVQSYETYELIFVKNEEGVTLNKEGSGTTVEIKVGE